MLGFWGRCFKKIAGFISIVLWILAIIGGYIFIRDSVDMDISPIIGAIAGLVIGFIANVIIFGIVGIFCDIDNKVSKIAKD